MQLNEEIGRGRAEVGLPLNAKVGFKNLKIFLEDLRSVPLFPNPADPFL
jgi:hypothetical protein